MFIYNSVTALKIEVWFIPKLMLCIHNCFFWVYIMIWLWFYLSLRLARFPRNTIWTSRLLQLNFIYCRYFISCSSALYIEMITLSFDPSASRHSSELSLLLCNAHLTELEILNKPRCATARPSDLHSKLLST